MILGNGPSLTNSIDTIMSLRSNCDVFCVNSFPSTEHFIRIKPNHFVIVSREYFFPDYNRPSEQKIRDKIIGDLISKTTWEINFFIPNESKKNKNFLKKIITNKYIKPIYYNTTPIEGFRQVKHKLMELKLGLPRPHNVLIPTIFLSSIMKYQNLLLFGADHSWLPQIHVTEDNDAMVNQKHFYDIGSTKARTMHLKGQPRKLHEILHKFYLSFRAYHDLEDFAQSIGVNIYNCTQNSFIDAFKRLNKVQASSIISESL